MKKYLKAILNCLLVRDPKTGLAVIALFSVWDLGYALAGGHQTSPAALSATTLIFAGTYWLIAHLAEAPRKTGGGTPGATRKQDVAATALYLIEELEDEGGNFTPAEQVALAAVSDALVAISDPDNLASYVNLDKRHLLKVRVWYSDKPEDFEESP